MVKNNCGAQFAFNGKSRAKVRVNKDDGKDAVGICGNCNSIKDDFRKYDGTDVRWYPKKQKFEMIGNSHWVPGYNENADE